MDSTVASETDPSQYLAQCPVEMKVGPNMCYCTCAWMDGNKRRIKLARKLIRRSFVQEDYDAFLLHMIPWSSAICACPHGNFLMQEVLASASVSTLQIFISSCPITDIMENDFGSRVVENLIQMYNGLFVPLIFNRVSHLFNRLARNQRANYCIQKLCELMPLENYGVVMRVALPFARRLSMDPHGAYVVQVILNRLHLVADYGFLFDDGANPPAQIDIDQHEPSYAMFEAFLNDLVEEGPKMIQHSVGNFTVQALVGVLHLCPSAEQQFVNGICEHIVMYVACKFGTRVVESVLGHGSYWAKEQIVNRMMQLNESEFSFFMRTTSAQYLYPKVLLCADAWQKEVFQEMMCHALADSANPYAVGMLIEDTSPEMVPPLTKNVTGNYSYMSSSSSSGDETVDVPFEKYERYDWSEEGWFVCDGD